MAERELIVRVIGDDRSLQAMAARDQKAVKKLGAELEVTGGRFSKFSQAARGGLSGFGGRSSLLFGSGAFLSTAGLTAGLKLSIDAASDLNEQITKSEQVFKGSSKEILDWSRTTAKAIGVSQEQALEAAGTFGNLFSSIHLGSDQSAETSRRLVQLASDLASFNNADPGQVLEDLRSGLVGEAEPLRKYGILLSEARVQQEALRETGKQSVKDLTDQEKALARVNIIFRDSTNAQGDFARTSEGLANQQRILSAEIKDLEANLGNLLLPAVIKITAALVTATNTANDLVDGLRRLGEVEIPPIKIPFFFDIPGGSLAGEAKGAFLGIEKNLPFNRIVLEVAKRIAAQFDAETRSQTPELAAQFQKSLGGFFNSALNQAVQNVGQEQNASAFQAVGPKLDIGALLGGALNQAIQISRADLQKAIAAEKKGLADAAKEAAAAKLQDQFNQLTDSLQLEVDRAGLTKDLGDDLDALKDLKAGLEKQVKAGVDVTAAQSALVSVVGQIADKQEEIRAKAAEAVQARQFRALGLGGTGEDLIPGVENLRKQLGSLSRRLAESGADLPSKLAQQLAGARKVLSGELGKATSESRSKINELFKTIRDTFDQQSKQGPLTRNSVFQANKILEGLGLSPEIEAQIRRRVNAFNNADVRMPRFNAGTTATSAGAAVIVENHNTITLDGDVVARNTTRSQQKTRRRNPVQKRGPNRGI